MMRLYAALVVVLFSCFVVTMSAEAQSGSDPLIGPDQFPQFRNLSGLAGGGYGVDARGYRSLSGPTALTTPTANVLGHNQWWIGLVTASYNDGPAIVANANGTAVGTFGTTVGRINIAVSDMLLSSRLDQAFNLQLQYISSPGSRWTGSAGVQDVGGGGGSSGDQAPGDARSSRSFFAVATYRIDARRNPLYLSGGGGTRRFRNGFGSVSYQIAGPARAWLEYDGFGVNEGVLFTLRTSHEPRTVEVNILVGFIKSRYLTLGGGVGF